MKAAYICEPQIGGTFSFFQQLRPAMAPLGVDLVCVPPVSASQIAASPFRNAEGVRATELSDSLPEATEQLIDFLLRESCDLVMTLPCCGVLTANLPRYLPSSLRCVVRVPMMTRGAYAPTQAVADYMDAAVAVSDRVADDLCRKFGVGREKVSVIYNSVAMSGFPARAPGSAAEGRRRVLYVGRLSDLDKGVLLLPEILQRVVEQAGDVELWVAGDGPDRSKLEAAFRARGVLDRVRMLGAVPYAQVKKLYYEVDVFILPSRFEGCPNALMEAMAAGCACAASRIKDSVSRIVEDGVSGLLFQVGDAEDAATAVLKLARDPALMARLAAGGRQRIVQAFTVETMAQKYADVFRRVVASPLRQAPALTVSNYTIPAAMRPTWRTRVPEPIKRVIRTWMERRGRSV